MFGLRGASDAAAGGSSPSGAGGNLRISVVAFVALRVLLLALAVLRAILVVPWTLVQYVATALPVVLVAVFARLTKVVLEVVAYTCGCG